MIKIRVLLTQEAKSQPLKMFILILSIETHYSQISQLVFQANFHKIFMIPAEFLAKKQQKVNFAK